MSLVVRSLADECLLDELGWPVPKEAHGAAAECLDTNTPFVYDVRMRVSRADVRVRAARGSRLRGRLPYVGRACEDLERQYGAGLRATAEYRGLSGRRLIRLLARREAVDLVSGVWVSVGVVGFSR